MRLQAVLFDLSGTLAYVKDPVGDEDVLRFLESRGYGVYPQAWRAAWGYLAFVDYPSYGYKTWKAYLTRLFRLLRVRVDGKTLMELVKLYERAAWVLYPDVVDALTKAKELKLKTAVITTIARFKYQGGAQPRFGQNRPTRRWIYLPLREVQPENVQEGAGRPKR